VIEYSATFKFGAASPKLALSLSYFFNSFPLCGKLQCYNTHVYGRADPLGRRSRVSALVGSRPSPDERLAHGRGGHCHREGAAVTVNGRHSGRGGNSGGLRREKN
jgi:hypothetical protein